MRLIQIVPRLRPFDGVADYAMLLARRLREAHGVTSAFVAVEEGGGAAGIPDGVHVLSGRSSRSLAVALEAMSGAASRVVLLHYVGYGYARRGAPLWLVRAISQTRRESGYRLGVVFHELFATGPAWTSAFWLRRLQQALVRRLAGECDWALVTREGSRRWLDGGVARRTRSPRVLAICSNVGEPHAVPRASARPATMVVWGGVAAKQALYRERWSQLEQACRCQGITRIVDLGARLQRYPRGAIVIDARGRLSGAEVSSMLQMSRFGVLRYPASYLAKSSVFAGYAAHGVVPLLDEPRATRSLDGLDPGHHFLTLGEAGDRRLSDTDLDERSQRVKAWYEGHSSTHHADAVWQFLQESGS